MENIIYSTEELCSNIVGQYLDRVYPKNLADPKEGIIESTTTNMVQEIVSTIDLGILFNLIYTNVNLRPYVAKNKHLTEKYVRLLLENISICNNSLTPTNYIDVLENLINNPTIINKYLDIVYCCYNVNALGYNSYERYNFLAKLYAVAKESGNEYVVKRIEKDFRNTKDIRNYYTLPLVTEVGYVDC